MNDLNNYNNNYFEGLSSQRIGAEYQLSPYQLQIQE